MEKMSTIPVEKAIQITANWRSFYAEIYNDSVKHEKKIDPNGEEVFRGFRIPIADLEQLLKIAKIYNEDHTEKIHSVRAYLVKDSERPEQLKDIHLILVPVVGGKEMHPGSEKAVAPFGYDLLQVKDSALEKEGSLIFDFTMPCPTECDPESTLYSSKS